MNRSVKFTYEKYLKKRTVGKAIIVSIIAFSFALLFLLPSKYQDASLAEVMAINDQEVIIYLARNDCPECQEIDALLQRNATKLSIPVYRIETRNEKDQTTLKQLIAQKNITKVPTFLLKKDQTIEIVEVNLMQKILFFRN